MSSSKVKQFVRTLTVTSDVVTGSGPYTHTITTPTHNLATSDVVQMSIVTEQGDYQLLTPAVTVTNATVFTVSLTTSKSQAGSVITVQYYSGGMTGGQPSVSWPQQSTPGVIQVVSTGAATVAIEGSLDNTNWANIATVTLGAAGSDYFILDAAWAYIRPNITSIAATKLVKIYRSV
jgi:hypothetical protein